MKRLKIGGRLNLVSLAAMVGLVLLLAVSLLRLDAVMREDIADRTRKTVETAHSILVHFHGEESAGRMSRAQAQAAALAAVGAMRYGNDDYFWVNDMQPRMIMHPFQPALNGTDISGKTDANGIFMFREMVAVVRSQGEGFVYYDWEKPGETEAEAKVSFVKGFAPWGWVIGSGVYMTDIRTAVRQAVINQSLIALAIILAVAGLSWLLGRSIARPVSALSQRMRGLAAGDVTAPIPGHGRGDEIGEMADALAVFRDAAIAKAEADAEKARADADQKHVVDTLSHRLAAISNGDLTAEIDVEFPGTYAAVKRDFNAAIANLRDLIASVARSTAAIRSGSGEIARASEDLARRTESNAASLEQTSAALTQMEARLRESTLEAHKTVERTSQAKGHVDVGRATADEAMGAMNRVADSARGIDQVIEGLDKIAFQTRVLAMNAAVEAGRAGEAGRGFAVVADLVSALAMRSEEEAKRAREQLTSTQVDILAAVESVEKVDGALANITGGVEQVHELVGKMASDNQAQSATISEISSAVGAMDRSTQQNAAMVEETSAAAHSLAQEVQSLAEHASQFRIEAGSPAKGPRPRGKNDGPSTVKAEAGLAVPA